MIDRPPYRLQAVAAAAAAARVTAVVLLLPVLSRCHMGVYNICAVFIQKIAVYRWVGPKNEKMGPLPEILEY